MTEQILFDRLRYMDKLTGAGIPEPQARAHADAMDNALRESVATKNDLVPIKTEIARLDAKIDIAVRDVTIRIGGMIVAAVAILIAIKFFG